MSQHKSKCRLTIAFLSQCPLYEAYCSWCHWKNIVVSADIHAYYYAFTVPERRAVSCNIFRISQRSFFCRILCLSSQQRAFWKIKAQASERNPLSYILHYSYSSLFTLSIFAHFLLLQCRSSGFLYAVFHSLSNSVSHICSHPPPQRRLQKTACFPKILYGCWLLNELLAPSPQQSAKPVFSLVCVLSLSW